MCHCESCSNASVRLRDVVQAWEWSFDPKELGGYGTVSMPNPAIVS